MSWLHGGKWNIYFKRVFDLAVGLLILTLSLPLLLIVAVLIKLDSNGPVLFIQKRLGKNGAIFNCFKFRTMAINAEQILVSLLEEDPALKSEWQNNYKLKHDPRVTRIGTFLRRTSLDELPQIVNVMLGQMSLVGPRPRPLYELDGRKNNHMFMVGLSVPPGMTGLWQVSGRNKHNFEKRVIMDAVYVRKWSLCYDIRLLLRTAGIVISQKGAF